MDYKEIFNELLKSPRLKRLLQIPEDEEIRVNYDSDTDSDPIKVIRNIIEGQVRHSGNDVIFNNIKRIFNL